MNDLFDRYISLYAIKFSNTTLNSDIATYNKHFRHRLGTKDLRDINFTHFQEYVNELISKDYSIKTIKNILTRLNVIFNFALKLEVVSKNPIKFVELPKFDNRVYFCYPLDTQVSIIKAIKQDSSPYADIFFFLLHGRRKSEVLNMRFNQVDFSSKIYTIPFRINKAKRNQSYALSDELYARLLKRYDKIDDINSYIFINPRTNNKYICIKRAWHRFLKANNLPIIRLHDIRHLVASYCINHLGFSIEQVSFMLGHTNINTTQRYITTDISTNRIGVELLLNSVD